MSGNPSDLECHPYDADIIYMTIGSKVFKSFDRGESWDNISGTIPEIPVNNIEYDRSSNEGLYIGTDAGVYYKNAEMDDWVLYGTELPASVEVSELEIYYDRFNRNESRLRASTFGRGMWDTELAPSNGVILPPYFLQAFVSPYDVELSWNPPLFPNMVSGYNIYRNDELLTTTSSTTYLDRDVDRKIYNSYKVSANYQSGAESEYTNTIKILAPVNLPYEQNFESGTQGWQGKFSPDGWNYGTENELNITGNDGLFFGINSAYAGDDLHVMDYLITPSIDLAEYEGQTITLKFMYTMRRYMKFDQLHVVYRPDIESEWVILKELEPGTGSGWVWLEKAINLPQEALLDGMQIGFYYDDSNAHAWGAGIDDIELSVNTTSVFNMELNGRLDVFPNPNNGTFDIQIELDELQDVSLTLRDMQGRKIWENEFRPEGLKCGYKVNMGNVAPGNYQLFMESGKLKYSRKIIVQ
jgi:hypothetical protein